MVLGYEQPLQGGVSQDVILNAVQKSPLNPLQRLKFALGDIAGQEAYLQEKYGKQNVYQPEQGQFVVGTDRGFQQVDPKGFNLTDIPLDILEYGLRYGLPTAGQAIGGTAGLLGGLISSLPEAFTTSPLTGALGAAAGAGIGGGVGELLTQGLGKGLGIRQDINMPEVFTTGALGATMPAVGKALGGTSKLVGTGFNKLFKGLSQPTLDFLENPSNALYRNMALWDKFPEGTKAIAKQLNIGPLSQYLKEFSSKIAENVKGYKQGIGKQIGDYIDNFIKTNGDVAIDTKPLFATLGEIENNAMQVGSPFKATISEIANKLNKETVGLKDLKYIKNLIDDDVLAKIYSNKGDQLTEAEWEVAKQFSNFKRNIAKTISDNLDEGYKPLNQQYSQLMDLFETPSGTPLYKYSMGNQNLDAITNAMLGLFEPDNLGKAKPQSAQDLYNLFNQVGIGNMYDELSNLYKTRVAAQELAKVNPNKVTGINEALFDVLNSLNKPFIEITAQGNALFNPVGDLARRLYAPNVSALGGRSFNAYMGNQMNLPDISEMQSSKMFQGLSGGNQTLEQRLKNIKTSEIPNITPEMPNNEQDGFDDFNNQMLQFQQDLDDMSME